ncbi:hypothetical protein [Dulcicalothrix desertica]|nr:hypothetical protein [Dulcicalothrix desertica]
MDVTFSPGILAPCEDLQARIYLHLIYPLGILAPCEDFPNSSIKV